MDVSASNLEWIWRTTQHNTNKIKSKALAKILWENQLNCWYIYIMEITKHKLKLHRIKYNLLRKILHLIVLSNGERSALMRQPTAFKRGNNSVNNSAPTVWLSNSSQNRTEPKNPWYYWKQNAHTHTHARMQEGKITK